VSKTRIPGGLPGRANATIRSPAELRINSPRSGFGTAPSLPQSLDLPGIFVTKAKRHCRNRIGRGGRFGSLRLSVRTPPFHGGESGSIPLGSAIGSPITLIFLPILLFFPNAQERFGN
jgi:hypothetical protein